MEVVVLRRFGQHSFGHPWSCRRCGSPWVKQDVQGQIGDGDLKHGSCSAGNGEDERILVGRRRIRANGGANGAQGRRSLSAGRRPGGVGAPAAVHVKEERRGGMGEEMDAGSGSSVAGGQGHGRRSSTAARSRQASAATEEDEAGASSSQRWALVVVAGDGGGAEEAVEAGAGRRRGGVLLVAGDVDMGRRSRR